MPVSASLSPRLVRLKQNLTSSNRSYTEDKVEATVGLLLIEERGDLETLLIQRTERHDDPWSGQIGLPGGRVKVSDQSVKLALQREVVEEVGVDLALEGEELGPLTVGRPMRRLEMRVQPWVYGLKERPRVNIGPEVGSAFWVSLSSLPLRQAKSEVSVRGEHWTVECFNVEGKIIWGFTYRVLTELLQIPAVLEGS